MPNYCVNCGNPLTLDNECNVCGHLVIQERRENHKCEFRHGNNYCPAKATIKSERGSWLCSAHYRCRENKTQSVKILEDFLTFGIPAVKDWRDQLLEQHVKAKATEKGNLANGIEEIKNSLTNG